MKHQLYPCNSKEPITQLPGYNNQNDGRLTMDFAHELTEKMQAKGVYCMIDYIKGDVIVFKPTGDGVSLADLHVIAEVCDTDNINVGSEYDAGYSDLTPGDGWYHTIMVTFPPEKKNE